MKRWLATISLIAALAVAASAAVAYWGYARWTGDGPATEVTRVQIPRGAGLARIAATLEEAGVLGRPGDRLVFTLGVTLSGLSASLRAGEYDIPPATGPEEVARRLAAGKGLVQYPLTVPEGLTTPQVLDLVRAAPHLQGDISVTPATGTLLPETYHYLRDDSRDAVVRRMREAMDEVLDRLWQERAPDLPIASKEEAVILASIVEKETAVPEERPLVAGVFINRLRRGMRLQSDPTVIYGLAPESGELDRPLLRKDLEQEHPWNTYVIDGLPPSPIANPGRESLEAVLNPADTDALYFVADGTGGHAFAKTLREHNRNVAKWRRLQRAKH